LDDKKLYEQGMFTLIVPFTCIFADFGKFAAPAEEDGLLSPACAINRMIGIIVAP